MKTVTLSVRIAPDEAAFLARLSIPNTATPSDKLRAIIRDAREREEGPHDYRLALADARRLLAPALDTLSEAEAERQHYSVLVNQLREWLPELLAYVRSLPADGEAQSGIDLETFERGLADRFCRLAESLLQAAITPSCHCYDPNVLNEYSRHVRELARVLVQTESLQEEP